MFGAYYFGWPYWADSPNVVIIPPPVTVPPTFTYQTLVVECRTRTCEDVTGNATRGDFSLSRLQEIAEEVEPFPRVECQTRICPEMPGDLTTYNLQDAIFFNGTPLSYVVNCPVGYVCPTGSFPTIFNYPPGTFQFPIPPTIPGNPIVLWMRGCSSTVSIVLPAGSSQADQNAAAQQMFQQIGAQQAQCDAIKSLPPGSKLPVPISLTAITQYACVNTPFSATIFASSTPSGAPFTMIVAPQPAWMVTAQGATSLFMDGTPIAIGPVNFTVTATGTNATGSKSYTLNIVGIATASPLPNGAIGGAYSETLDASSIPGVLVWSVVSGALPDGLTLDPVTGEIAGTPTTDIIAAFTISASNGTVTCSKDFDLEITSLSACDSLLTGAVWSVYSDNDFGGGTSTGTGAGNTFSGNASTPALDTVIALDTLVLAGAGKALSTTVSYTGPAITCCLKLKFNGTTPGLTNGGIPPFGQWSTTFNADIFQDGNPILTEVHDGTGIAVDYSFTFNLANSPTPSVLVFDFAITCASQALASFFTPATCQATSGVLTLGHTGDCP